MVRGFVDSVLQFEFVDNAGLAIPDGPGNILYFFQDDPITGGMEAASGFVDYIAIYDTAVIPEPSSMALAGLSLSLALASVAARRRSRGNKTPQS